jgi:hypothetical protein
MITWGPNHASQGLALISISREGRVRLTKPDLPMSGRAFAMSDSLFARDKGYGVSCCLTQMVQGALSGWGAIPLATIQRERRSPEERLMVCFTGLHEPTFLNLLHDFF